MQNEPINTGPIQQFLKQVKGADAGRAKDVTLDIQQAKSLMMSSNEINGTELNNLGVLHKLCSLEDMDKEFDSLIENLNKQSFISICMIKQQIREGLDKTFSESLDLETVNQNKRFLHSDAAEGMAAFLEKRPPAYKNTLDE